MKPKTIPKFNTFEKELDFYRSKYFLDPDGSNLKDFVVHSNQMLEALLRLYTKRDLKVNIEFSDKGKNAQVTIINQLSPQAIKKKVMSYSEKGLPYEIPFHGHSIEEMIDAVADLSASEVCFNAQFLGQMHPHDNMVSYIAGIAAKFINGNTIVEEVSRVTTYLEKQVVNWLGKEFGYNPDVSWMSPVTAEGPIRNKLEKLLAETPISSGNITVGGTTANFAALLVARNKAFQEDIYWRKAGVAEEGLSQKEECVVFGSEYAHYSIEKLCGYAGIGSKKFVKVKTKGKKIEVDHSGPGSLREMMWQAAKESKKVVGVVATAGTTETGNIDDLEGIANLLDDFEKKFNYRPHFHVDAAHGGGFVLHDQFNPKKKGKFKGIERADSITIDPHKMLYTHYSAGCILFKDRKDHALLKQTADYLFKNDEDNNLGQYRVEGSIGLEGTIQTWASLFALGKRGYQVIQQQALDMTAYLEEKLKEEGVFEILHEREMNLLCFRYNNPQLSPEINNEINREAQKIMYKRGKAYISNDKLLPEYDHKKEKIDVFRAVVMHPYTKKKDIDLAISEVKQGINEYLQKLTQVTLIPKK